MRKELIWIGSSLEDLRDFPQPVTRAVGFAIGLAQEGGKHLDAKPLKGFHGSGVLEVVEDFDGDTFRAVYTVRFEEAVYVLHCFQKKSKSGVATPKQEMDLVSRRLKTAEQEHSEWQKKERNKK